MTIGANHTNYHISHEVRNLPMVILEPAVLVNPPSILANPWYGSNKTKNKVTSPPKKQQHKNRRFPSNCPVKTTHVPVQKLTNLVVVSIETLKGKWLGILMSRT